VRAPWPIGTKTTFHPDLEIFKNVLEFSFDQLSTNLKGLAYLNGVGRQPGALRSPRPAHRAVADRCGDRPRLPAQLRVTTDLRRTASHRFYRRLRSSFAASHAGMKRSL